MPGISTIAVHGGQGPDATTGSVQIPIHQTSTYLYPELPDGSRAPYIYSRYENPTVEAVEAKLAALEGATGALCFQSGMAATSTLCTALLSAGDRVAVQRGVYGGTTAYLQQLERFGVEVVPFDPEDGIPDGVRLVWVEAITNPLLRVSDIPALAAAKDPQTILCVDATFASAALVQPLALGADVVMHSATKYLGGHSDITAGALAWRDDGLREDLWRTRRNLGATLDPHTAFLLSRGMRTLVIRMAAHCRNAQAVAEEAAKWVPVHYPGLEGHPDHDRAADLLAGNGGMVTLDVGSLDAAKAFRRATKVFAPAASLGGVESLVSLPVETSHAYMSPEERQADGITDGLVRLSVGIEDTEDLLADLRLGLGKA